MGQKFGNQRVAFRFCRNDVFALLPAILFYRENEEFTDAEVFIITIKFLIFDALMFVKIKKKYEPPKLDDPVIRE